MRRSSNNFNDKASGKGRQKTGYPPPFSLRLTFEERARLEKEAAGMALGAYIRMRLFGEDAEPRRTRGKFPVKDHEALGRVLGALGASRLSSNLNQLAKAVNTGSLPVTSETEDVLFDACEEILAIRIDLLRALGHPVTDEPAGDEP